MERVLGIEPSHSVLQTDPHSNQAHTHILEPARG
jgi:hypothetical protein